MSPFIDGGQVVQKGNSFPCVWRRPLVNRPFEDSLKPPVVTGGLDRALELYLASSQKRGGSLLLASLVHCQAGIHVLRLPVRSVRIRNALSASRFRPFPAKQQDKKRIAGSHFASGDSFFACSSVCGRSDFIVFAYFRRASRPSNCFFSSAGSLSPNFL